MRTVISYVFAVGLAASTGVSLAAGGPIVINLSGGDAATSAAHITVDGQPYTPGTVIQDTVFPTQHCVRITGEGVHVQFWYADGGIRQPPQVNGDHWLMGSTNADVKATHTAYVTTNAYWVDPTNGVDDAEHGTEAAPFRTPLYAAERAEYHSVIYCAPGDYREGEYYYAGMTNRLYNYGKYLRFVGAGIGKSILHGKLDLESPTHLANGRGPAAMRVMAVNSGYAIVQNFTVTEGRCASVVDGTTNVDMGGAGYNANFVDCLITNCAAYRGQVTYFGTLMRCRISMCDSAELATGGRLIEGGAIAYCCIFGQQANAKCKPVFEDYTCWQCTGGWIDSQNRVYGSGAKAYNCATVSSYGMSDSWNFTMKGCVTKWTSTPSEKMLAQDVLNEDPLFVDASHGDYRLYADSPAVGYGYLPEDYYRKYSAGIDGAPVTFKNGRPTAGAVQQLASFVDVSATSKYAETDVAAGRHAVAPGESLTVSVVNANRPPIGFVVNGATVAGMSYTLTAPASGATTAEISGFVFGTNWYANANADSAKGVVGSDANDGFTPATAKKTLISLCTNQYVLAGDTIHAAPGDYNEGAYSHNPGSCVIRSRVIVKSNTTVVGDGGQDVTFITGAPAEGQVGGSNSGCGDTAIRCAYGADNSVLRGFTLRDGYTDAKNSTATTLDSYAGGYLGGGTSAHISDCTITNCYGGRSPLCHGGLYYGCSLMGNNKNAGTGFDRNYLVNFGGFYNCRIITSSNFSIMAPFVNCIMCNKSTYSTSGQYQIYCAPSDLPMLTNCVIVGSIRNSSSLAESANYYYPAISNNIVCTGFAGTTPSAICKAWFKVLTAAQIKKAYDIDTLEFTGAKDANFCDAGVNVAGQEDETDVNGGQRIYNGTVDLGPAEYDWRGDYASAIGDDISVASASPAVTLTDAGRVRLNDGATLDLAFGVPKHGVVFDVQGGVLKANGKSVTGGTVKTGHASNLNLAFEGADGYADITGVEPLHGVMLIVR